RLEVREAREGERAPGGPEVHVVELTVLPTELEGVPAARVADGIGEDDGGIDASLGEAVRASEVETHALHRDLREDDGLVDPVLDSQVGGVGGDVGREGDVDAVEAEAGLVHEAGPEDVRVVQGADLAVRGAGVAEASPLGVAQDAAVEVELLALPQALVGDEEERLVLRDGTAQVGPELVPLEGRLLLARGVEEVPGVQGLVTQELESLPVNVIRAVAGGDVDARSRAAPVLGAEGGVVDVELRRRVDGGLARDLVL